jgi:spore coat polysaccharide biosynthesis protein SpsF (cytidylyltransferase family)
VENVIIITQARIASTRLPGKVIMKVGPYELLSIHLKRLKKSKLVKSILVATTFEKNIEQIISIAKKENVRYFQGSTENVLQRFFNAAKNEKPDYIVRVTSDCPLIDGELIDQVIKKSVENNLDYCSNALIESYPDGQDIEVIKWSALKASFEKAKTSIELEHVTPFVRENSSFCGGKLFSSMNFESVKNYGNVRMTVDEYLDFKAIEKLVNHFGIEEKWKTYADYILNNPDEFLNQSINRNEGYFNSIKKK